MAMRTTIHLGAEWRIWDVRPTAARRLGRVNATAAGMEEGWLCFESETEKRRAAPIPQGWDGWTEAELRACLEAAEPVVRRRPSYT